jgi:hypothetical protein
MALSDCVSSRTPLDTAPQFARTHRPHVSYARRVEVEPEEPCPIGLNLSKTPSSSPMFTRGFVENLRTGLEPTRPVRSRPLRPNPSGARTNSSRPEE